MIRLLGAITAAKERAQLVLRYPDEHRDAMGVVLNGPSLRIVKPFALALVSDGEDIQEMSLDLIIASLFVGTATLYRWPGPLIISDPPQPNRPSELLIVVHDKLTFVIRES